MEPHLLLSGIYLTLLLFIAPNSAQDLPYNSCPDIFQYLEYNQQYVGRISVQHDPQYQENTLRVELSQRGTVEPRYVGRLTLWDDDEITQNNIRNGLPIQYRVDFPTPGKLPKVKLITINGNEICKEQPYYSSTPLVTLRLSHSLTAKETVLPSPSPTQKTVQPNATAVVRLTPPVTQTVQLDEVCGRERAITTPLIVQGKQLERGQLPWLVGLFERYKFSDLTFFCGGTLISSSTVISAAHCFLFTGRDLPANQAVVSLGRNSIDIISNGELRDVSELLIHEQYKLSSYKQPDMALIRLATKVPFTDYIVPICLWNENLPQQLPSGYKAYVAGWGADGNGNSNTKFSKITDIDIITEAKCLSELPAGLVQSQTICAKKTGTGPCASDGGGGLMLRENNVWLLRGVISASAIEDNTCDLSKPSVYSDVARQIDWVRQNMWD